jgi:hypothetical protein
MSTQRASNLDLPEALVSMRNTITRLVNDVIAGRDLSETDWSELIDGFCSARQSWQGQNRRAEEGESVRHLSC